MPDRWRLVEGEGGWEAWRNGQWYSAVEDEDDGVGLLRNRRAKEVEIEYSDGMREQRRL